MSDAEVTIDKKLAPGAKVVCLWKDSREGVIVRERNKYVAAIRPKGATKYVLEKDRYTSFKLIFEAYAEDNCEYKLIEPELERQLKTTPEQTQKGPRTAFDPFIS